MGGRTGDFLMGMAGGAASGIDTEKQRKQALLLELMKSGQFQPSQNQAPQGNFMQRLGSNVMGPNLASNNPNLMGLNLERVTPEMQAETLKRTMSAYAPLMGATGGTGTMKPSFSVGADGKPSMSFKSVDPMTSDLNKGRLQAQKDLSMQRQNAGKLRLKKFYQTEFDKIAKDANASTATSRNPLGMASRANFSANRALQTLQNPVVTNQEAGNVMADIASIYQGGAPTQFGMSEQGYKTIMGQLAGAMQYISGKPTDAVPPQIKQRLTEVLNGMKRTNMSTIKQQLDFVERSKRNIIQHFPDQWKELRETALSEDYNGLSSSQASGGQGGSQAGQVDYVSRYGLEPNA